MGLILIADDERIEREGIKFLLKQYGFGLEIKEAVNGRAALEYLNEHKTDILLTDIKMPFMDGLMLSDEARKLYPDIKIIIFSGYSEFEYARQAMKSGVSGYILKPVDPEEFKRTLQSVLDQMKKEEEQKNNQEKERGFLLEHFLLLLLNGTKEETILQRAKGHISPDLFERYRHMILIEWEQNFFDNAGSSFDQMLRDEIKIPFQYLNLDEKQSILLFEKQVNCDFNVLAKHIATYLTSQFKRKVYLCVSGSFSGTDELCRIYNLLEGLLENRFYYNEVTIFYQDQELLSSSDEDSDEKLTKRITEDIQNKDTAALSNHFERLGRKYQQKKDYSQIYVKFIFSNIIREVYSCLSEANEKDLVREIDRLYRSSDIFDVIAVTKGNIERLFESLSREEKTARSEVETIKKYIYKNYNKDIAIEELAKEVCLAPSYVSFIFKKETGQNLSKYIKAYRMERAKRLVKDSHDKIVTISQAVGYNNVSYFCQSFREYFGVSPEKFRKNGE